MTLQQYEKGKIKVVWADKEPEKIFSKMFATEHEAIRFAKNKDDFVIFKLLEQKDMEQFSWQILPYGKYKMYLGAMTTYRGGKKQFLKLLNGFI